MFNLETFGFTVPPAFALLNYIHIKEAETLSRIFFPNWFFCGYSPVKKEATYLQRAERAHRRGGPGCKRRRKGSPAKRVCCNNRREKERRGRRNERVEKRKTCDSENDSLSDGPFSCHSTLTALSL